MPHEGLHFACDICVQSMQCESRRNGLIEVSCDSVVAGGSCSRCLCNFSVANLSTWW